MTLKSNDITVAIGLSFYQDIHSLGRCMRSVVRNLPIKNIKVFAVDGIYEGYGNLREGESGLSTDGSRGLIESYMDLYGFKVRLSDYPNQKEYVKRQRYVDLAAARYCDFLLIMDADEYLECKDQDAFINELVEIDKAWKENSDLISNVHNIKFVERNNLGYIYFAYPSPRLWYRPGDMEYMDNHGMFRRKVKRNVTDGKSYTIENMQMWHDHNLRPKDRQRQSFIYEKEMLPRLERDYNPKNDQ